MPRKAGEIPDRDSGENRIRPGEVYFEFLPVGKAMKVMAIDAATGIEVAIVGPVSASQAELEDIALRKLRMRLAKDGGR